MKKAILIAALALIPAASFTGRAVAQTQLYGTEVCVNASNATEAKRLFPNASLHVLPDLADPDMNGWRIVSGSFDANGRIHSDERELQLRQNERAHDSSRRGE